MFEYICNLINQFLQALPGDWAMYLGLSFWVLVCAMPVIFIILLGYFIYRCRKPRSKK